jgi:ubiquinone/menaquinone biosynthesis C-methylase UbiE
MSREKRAEKIYENYKGFLEGKILDVGCAESYIKKYISDYTGIDIEEVNLEKEKIPFSDNTFDLVLCSHVLEHIENIDIVFKELLRVSKKYVLILLPNASCFFWSWLRTGVISQGNKYTFKLGRKKGERHKWFMGYSEIINFLKVMSSVCKFRIIDVKADTEYHRITSKFIIKCLFRKHKNIIKELFAPEICCLLKKTSENG